MSLYFFVFKGAFKVEMQRKDEKDRKIICKYDPLEVNLRIIYFLESVRLRAGVL